MGSNDEDYIAVHFDLDEAHPLGVRDFLKALKHLGSRLHCRFLSCFYNTDCFASDTLYSNQNGALVGDSKMNGTFQIIAWDESEKLKLADDTKITIAEVKQNYTGSLMGSSEVCYQMFYTANGNAAFTGFEVLSCTEGDSVTTLVLNHSGKFENGVASSAFRVEHSNHQGIKKGATGHFKSKEGGMADYTFED
ncbi:DUF3224 domain-containing protein [Ningiella sp. W23]|uniref:DUF3224 domain-containing protein n=1 Tax=Ningiella sp. W23 TaxID=3023715 RepID=UPI003756B16E